MSGPLTRSPTELSDRWIVHQQIGLIAHCLHGVAPGEEGDEAGNQRLCELLDESTLGWPLERAGMRLPPSTLAHLRNLAAKPAGLLWPQLARALTVVVESDRAARRAQHQVRRMARLIVHGQADARTLNLAARALFDTGTRGTHVPFVRLDEVLEEMRQPDRSVDERCRMVLDLWSGNLLNFLAPSVAHRQMVNALFGSFFGWPLLATGSARPIGLSLPIAVDIQFSSEPDDSGTTTAGPRSKVVADASIIASDEWTRTFALASRAAWKLWKRGHVAESGLGRALARSSLMLNLTHAGRIAESLTVFGIAQPVSLEGESAGVYLAQLVLARLLGRQNPSSTAVTGRIGQTIGTDHKTAVVGDVAAKLGYAVDSELFDRVVFPRNSSVQGAMRRAQRKAVSRLMLVPAGSLSSTADLVQRHGWRPHRYFGVPDLFHEARDNVRALVHSTGVDEISEVQLDLRERLAGSPSPVLRVRANRRDVLAVLERLNREATGASLRPADRLSWLFFRGDHLEFDAFWRTIWTVTGADSASLDSLLGSLDDRDQKSSLEELLNSKPSSGPRKRSMWVPDLLVLIQGGSASRGREHSPASVFELLDRDIRMVAESWRAHLGATRVILVQEPSPEPRELTFAARVERDAFRALSVFEDAVPHVLAESFLHGLGMGEHDARKALTTLIRRGFLIASRGEYFISPDARWFPRDTSASELKARRHHHFAAASALAPYLTKNPHSGTPLDVAFDSLTIGQALYHVLEVLREIGQGKRSDALRDVLRDHSAARRDLQILTVAGGVRSWAAIRRLFRSNSLQNRDGIAIVEEMLGRSELRAGGATWAEYTLAGAMALHAAESTQDSAMRPLAIAWLRAGWRKAQATQESGPICSAGTHLAFALMCFAAPDKAVDRVSNAVRRKLSGPIRTWGIGISKGWIRAYLGTRPPADAILVYRQLLISARISEAVVFGLGAAVEAGDGEAFQEFLTKAESLGVTADEVRNRHFRSGIYAKRPELLQTTQGRWSAGLKALDTRPVRETVPAEPAARESA